ncbi:MAG: MarR family transcriptional regulator [Saprospiraceae bacterium]|nr:MarR family transcriptional regulator [Saprospiraceae bacterium]
MKKKVEFHFNKAEESPGFLLWQLTMLWQRMVKRELDKIDLTHTQFVLLATLAWLSKTSDSVTQVDIANHSKTDRMMVSKVLRTLEDKGLLGRQEHATDTRAKSVSMTPVGEALLQTALKVVEGVDIDFFAKLGAREADFKADMLHLINRAS